MRPALRDGTTWAVLRILWLTVGAYDRATMLKTLLLWLLSLAALTGCGQVAVFGRVIGEPRAQGQNVGAPEPTPTPASSPPALPSSPIARHVSAIALTFTPDATTKTSADPRFKADALRNAIEAELRSRKLLDTKNTATSDTAQITISDFATRTSVNAVVFGYNLGSGSLAGEIRVGESSTGSSQVLPVLAETRLAIAASGDDKNPLAALYRRFAVLTADRLAGTPSKPEEPDRDLMPR